MLLPREVGSRLTDVQISEFSHTDIIGSSIGIIGILFGVFFYFRAKTEAIPLYAALEQTPAEPDMHSLLRGVQVLFWNGGRGTLDGSDIVPSDPIKLLFLGKARDPISIREVKLVRTTRPALNVSIVYSNSVIDLKFDFLNRSDGFLLEVLCAGSGPVKVDCTGTIKGVPRGVRRRIAPTLGEKGLVFLSSLMAIASLSWGVALPFMTLPPDQLASLKNGLSDARLLYIMLTYPLTFSVILIALGMAATFIVTLRIREKIPSVLRKAVQSNPPR